MKGWIAAAAVALTLVGPQPAAAESACRPTTLGTVSCPGVRPVPRPPYRRSVQALDRVRERTQQPAETEFIPARRTNRLGGTVINDGNADLCRADTLGNLHCR